MRNKYERKKKAIINMLFLVLTLLINTFGSIGLINGYSQKEVSDMYLTLITPSPSTFSIWGVIYSLLIISNIVMIIKSQDLYYKNIINEISLFFKLSCIFNILWIVSFSYLQLEISVLFIFSFLISLSLILEKLLKTNSKSHWLLPLTFGMYGGWLFIATVVNISATLVKLKWNGFGLTQDVWADIILIMAIILIFLVTLKNKNAAFPLPIAWAYIGIYNFLKSPEGFGGKFPILQSVSIGGMIILLILSIYLFYKNKYKIIPID